MKNRVTRNLPARTVRAASVLLASSLSVLLAGCTASQFLSESTNVATTGSLIHGSVHGGQQAVTGATIQLWAVGSSGYGSAASALLGSHVVTTDSGGNFNISTFYNCPAAPSNGNGNTYVYITSTGGNSGSGTNSNIVLAAALGSCSSLSSSTVININEVTTAATAYALGQYFGLATDNIGAPNTTQAQVGLANAFGTVNNLVNVATGNAVVSSTLANNGLTVTATPESAKLNTVADILAACVNSAGTSDSNGFCTTLFNDTVPTGGTAATDTLEAAVYMSLNPTSTNSVSSWPNSCTSNICALYALASATPPFTGVGTQPTDWTLGIQYTGSRPH